MDITSFMTDIPILYRLLKHVAIQPLNGTFWLAKRIERATDAQWQK